MIFINKYLIDLKLNDFKINCYGNIDNNKILFIHNNINYTFDIDKTILIKEDNNYLFTFLFKNNILILHDKIQNKDINISLLINKLEIFEKKIIIIPHTYDKDFYAKKVNKNNEKIVISYLGHCDDERTPKCFFEALGRLKSKHDNISDKLIVNFYGDLSVKDKARIIDEEIYDFVKVRKPVTYFESLKIMQESDWLLLIDANLGQYINENIFFAAKIADYLGANNNILGITMEKGASADILRETNSIISAREIKIMTSWKSYYTSRSLIVSFT